MTSLLHWRTLWAKLWPCFNALDSFALTGRAEVTWDLRDITAAPEDHNLDVKVQPAVQLIDEFVATVENAEGEVVAHDDRLTSAFYNETDSDRECAERTTCAAHEWQTTVPTSTSDRECQGKTNCTSTEWEANAGGATHDRGCEPVTECSSSQWEFAGPTYATDRVP